MHVSIAKNKAVQSALPTAQPTQQSEVTAKGIRRNIFSSIVTDGSLGLVAT
jgi:hypothetical protein